MHVGKLIALFSPRGVIAQPPRPEVHAAVQAGEELAIADPRVAAKLIPGTVDDIVHPRGVDTVLPAFLADIAPWQITHNALRQAETEGERFLVEIKAGAREERV